MNVTETDQWIAYHSSAFPNWGEWLKQHAETGEVIERILEDVSLRAAKMATDEMSLGSLAKPFHYEDHARKVGERGREIDAEIEVRLMERDLAIEAAKTQPAPVFIEGERVYKCARCRDEGYVAVVKLKTIMLARAGEYDDLIDWWRSYDCEVRDERERLLDDPNFSMTAVMEMTDSSLNRHKRKHGPKPEHKQYEGPQMTACTCFAGQHRNAQWQRGQNQQETKTQTVKRPAAVPQPPLPVYDPDIHLTWDYDQRDWVNLERAKQFCMSAAQNDLANALEEFDGHDFGEL